MSSERAIKTMPIVKLLCKEPVFLIWVGGMMWSLQGGAVIEWVGRGGGDGVGFVFVFWSNWGFVCNDECISHHGSGSLAAVAVVVVAPCSSSS